MIGVNMETITLAPAGSYMDEFLFSIVVVSMSLWAVIFVSKVVRSVTWGNTFLIALPVTIIFGIILMIRFDIKQSTDQRNRMVAALEQQLGYSNVNLDHDWSFTASNKGAYTEGYLVHKKGDDYIVVLE